MHMTTVGDPTLRLQVLAPATNLTGSRTAPGIVLEWSASSEASQYFIYRSTNGIAGIWTKLTGQPHANLRFTNASPPSVSTTYEVRALKLTSTGSGSFTNLSQGVFTTVP
jgi:hypothetical protein